MRTRDGTLSLATPTGKLVFSLEFCTRVYLVVCHVELNITCIHLVINLIQQIK